MALRPSEPRSPLGRGLELGMQIVFSVLLGLGGGFALDRWLGTEPVFLLVGVVLGFAAAVLTLVRFK